MASKRYAEIKAKKKARQVFRTNIRKPKKAVVKKFANFVGKVTYKQAKKGKKFGRKFGRRYSRRR